MFNAALTLASTLYIWYRAKEAATMIRTLGRAAITLRNAKFVSAAVAAKTLAPALIAAALIYATYRVAKKLYSEYKFYRMFYDEIDDTTFTQQNNQETIEV